MVSFDYTFDHIDMSSLEITIPKTYQAIDSYEQDCINIITIIDAALKKKRKSNSHLSQQYFKANIMLHLEFSFSGDEQYCCGQEYFKTNIDDTDFYPIIHFCKYDITEYPISKKRYAYIMDNSIWNYFIKYDNNADNQICIDENRILYVLNEIAVNTERGVYNLTVTREFAELNARIVEQSCLKGGHGLHVAPYIYHSERIINELIAKEIEEPEDTAERSTIERIRNQKWRLLLVEDKAVEPMTRVSEDTKEITKTEIIVNLLENQLNIIKNSIKKPIRIVTRKASQYKEQIDDEWDILIEYSETIPEAENAIKYKEYDIILLDYLLNKNEISYGYELLNNIYDNIKSNNGQYSYKIGPHNRFFFIFISAYSSAVYERLLAEGLNRSEKYWHIAVGACPTNTPKLFLYNLLKLMEKQLEDSGVDKISAKGIYDVVNKIYGESDNVNEAGLVRERANTYYQDVLDMHYLYRKMLKDVQIPSGNNENIFNTSGSVLISNFIIHNVNLGGFLEHLTQLVHLTAFGTVRQWPEMWEEYIYFKTQFDLAEFEKYYAQDAENNCDAKRKYYKLCEDIESYILNLKSDLR